MLRSAHSLYAADAFACIAAARFAIAIAWAGFIPFAISFR